MGANHLKTVIHIYKKYNQNRAFHTSSRRGMVKVTMSYFFPLSFFFFLSVITNKALNVGAKIEMEIHSGLF